MGWEILTASMTIWFIAAALVYLVPSVKRSVPIINTMSKTAGAGALIVLGLFMTGAITGLTGASVATSDVGGIDLYSMKFVEDAVLNGTGAGVVTGDDYYALSDTQLTLYIADAENPDDSAMNWTITMERAEVSKAATVLLTCEFDTQYNDAGTIKNLVSLDSFNNVEAYIDGAGTRTASGVSKLISFSEGTASVTSGVKVLQDETGQDGMDEKSQLYANCRADGKSVNIVFVADN